MADFIGQESNLRYLRQCMDCGKMPRFLILLGPKHFGKKTMAQYIAKHIIKSQPTETEPSIDSVRAVIEIAYKATAPTCYVFGDCDNMTTAALNALLKVTEEPPRRAYFILTSSTDVLETLASRACVLQMQSYTQDQLRQFTYDEYDLKVATSPGEVVALNGKSKELYEFCKDVLQSMGTVTGVNAMKIPGYLALKPDADGYDPYLFFQGMRAVIVEAAVAAGMGKLTGEALWAEVDKMQRLLRVCSDYQSKINKKGVRKDSLMDMWVLDMRAVTL